MEMLPPSPPLPEPEPEPEPTEPEQEPPVEPEPIIPPIPLPKPEIPSLVEEPKDVIPISAIIIPAIGGVVIAFMFAKRKRRRWFGK